MKKDKTMLTFKSFMKKVRTMYKLQVINEKSKKQCLRAIFLKIRARSRYSHEIELKFKNLKPVFPNTQNIFYFSNLVLITAERGLLQ